VLHRDQQMFDDQDGVIALLYYCMLMMMINA